MERKSNQPGLTRTFPHSTSWPRRRLFLQSLPNRNLYKDLLKTTPLMVKRIGSTYRKSKFKIQQTIRERGKIPLSRYFQTFAAGEMVGLKLQGNVVKGRFHPRFHGL